MSVTSSPDLAELAKAFKQAGAQLTLLANNSGVAQGDAIMKALNDVNSRLGNIEKSVVDLRQEFTDFRDQVASKQREKELREKEANEKRQQDPLRKEAM
jgi:predicted  nucleic acid-binding Zn-ribbon protein